MSRLAEYCLIAVVVIGLAIILSVFGGLISGGGQENDILTPPPLPQPEATAQVTPTQEIVFINPNPELALGSCWRVEFVTVKFGLENIKQCEPDAYELYEHKAIGSYPIRVIHTGAGYYILPNGAHGEIGFSLDSIELSGDYWLKVHFHADFEGDIGDYSVDAKANGMEVGKHMLEGNGPNTAVFYMPGMNGTYRIDAFLNLVHPGATASSSITITSITVEKAK